LSTSVKINASAIIYRTILYQDYVWMQEDGYPSNWVDVIIIYIFLLKESVLSLIKKKTSLVFLLSNCPQVRNICYDWPFNYYFWRFRYMFTMQFDRVQLSVYSTTAQLYRFCVAMK